MKAVKIHIIHAEIWQPSQFDSKQTGGRNPKEREEIRDNSGVYAKSSGHLKQARKGVVWSCKGQGQGGYF